MTSWTKNLLGISIAVGMIVGVLYALREFLDPVLGDGGTAILSVLLTGAGLAAALVLGGIMVTNLVHRAAGEDLTVALGDVVKTLTARNRVEQEYARMDREAAGFEGKERLLDHKFMQAQAKELAKIYAEAERQRMNAEAATRQPKSTAQSWMDSIFSNGSDVVDAKPDGTGQFWE